MQAVKVQYTVQPSFADTNAANIKMLMNALKAKPIEGVNYAVFRLDDNQTFVHIVVAQNEAARLALTNLPEFKAFQTALKESRPISPPLAEEWNVVGASFESTE